MKRSRSLSSLFLPILLLSSCGMSSTSAASYFSRGSFSKMLGAGVTLLALQSRVQGQTTNSWVHIIDGSENGEGDRIGYKIGEFSDGGYGVVGTTDAFEGDDMAFDRFSENGAHQWGITFHTNDSEIMRSMDINENDEFIIIGDTSSFGGDDIFYAIFNATGYPQLMRVVGGKWYRNRIWRYFYR